MTPRGRAGHKLTSKKCGFVLLKSLSRLKGDERKEMLEHLSDSCIDTLCQSLYNVMYARLPMSKARKSRLRSLFTKHKTAYKFITRKANDAKKRRKRLQNQSSGSLGVILNAIIPLLAELIFGQKKKKKPPNEREKKF
jgi:hypothetical protein